MEFIETRLFSRKVPNYLDDDDYRELQAYMLENPCAGDIIKGTGGIRKLRWTGKGKGKRGGVRVIYFLLTIESRFLMLTIYAKNEVQDLTAQEKTLLRRLVEEWDHV